MEYLVKTYTNGWYGLDNDMVSGTTILATIKKQFRMNRNRKAQYYDVAVRRRSIATNVKV